MVLVDAAVGRTVMLATGISSGAGLNACLLVLCLSFFSERWLNIVWRASVGVGLKVWLDYVDVSWSFVSVLLSSMLWVGGISRWQWPGYRDGDGSRGGQEAQVAFDREREGVVEY